MSVGKPAFAFTQYPYESRSITPDAQLEVTLFNRDLPEMNCSASFSGSWLGAAITLMLMNI